MWSYERLRNVGKMAADVGVAFPEHATNAAGAGGVCVSSRNRRRSCRRFWRLRALQAFVVIGLIGFALSCYGIVRSAHSAQRIGTPATSTRRPRNAKPPPPATPSSRPPYDDQHGRRNTATLRTPKSGTPLPTTQRLGFRNGTNATRGTATEERKPTGSDPRTVRPHMFSSDKVHGREEGEYRLEEPDRLPGLSISRRTYTAAELLEKFSNVDYIYSFVNGTEANHEYRKEVRSGCFAQILAAEATSYEQGYPAFLTPTTTAAPSTTSAMTNTNSSVQRNGNASAPVLHPFALLRCSANRIRNLVGPGQTVGALLTGVQAAARRGADSRDRETDELRHSIRSLEQHVQWHRGRVVIVSPGHHPTWVDGARNFLAGVCGGASVQALRSRGTHLRLTTVHQDALMPYGMRLTADSHVIEQHIWRVRNTTAVHVYMNDDYFVNRDVAITDLFNEYGGTIVRTEGGQIGVAAVGDHTASWAKGVSNTEFFNVQQLDINKEDDLPADLVAMWDALHRVSDATTTAGALPSVAQPPLEQAVDVAHSYSPPPPSSALLKARRVRFYATHAPFVYCTNMFRFLETRYEREFANASLHHRGRKARDLFLPFLYNAFIMARPWQASPQFLPYLMQLHRSRGRTPTEAPPSLSISLDNVDGCAPATLLAGRSSGCAYGKFSNNVSFNEGEIAYFRVNAR
ncbi:hypothetical protein ABB37_06704 [Leptomonas pyrrhocoris]|uniref:Stealth protein CR3 conserved region 3 domain-containing protein n=1 Tax=Leptomonas pyrrhocoris TaxID=157538 RepID=A0A0M9FXJ4_LEPPY|nr:hypothetical protein ABB37_06704 [Leptomonas pyrrhocoris]KPA77926.1 hypothetical protein ABB37_06704 [Leptomonas pyrrhocoris]|eukprot:XP_015656365.1 hypothetical protein ABB37_06704 [Leptomonas pyrrhocoris]